MAYFSHEQTLLVENIVKNYIALHPESVFTKEAEETELVKGFALNAHFESVKMDVETRIEENFEDQEFTEEAIKQITYQAIRWEDDSSWNETLDEAIRTYEPNTPIK